jgi:DNA ligase-1
MKELDVFLEMEKCTGEGSQKKKQSLISQNLSDKMLYLLDICFNPFVTTKIHKLEIDNSRLDRINYEGSEEIFWDTFVELVEDLKKAPAANDSLRLRASNILRYQFHLDPDRDLEIRKILGKVLSKRMNIGIGAKLINKAIGREIIPDPSLMLATDDSGEIVKWKNAYCEEKYDGVRVIAILNDDGNFSFFTRAFNEIDSSRMKNVAKELKKISGGLKNIFFDGELTDLNRKSVSGKVTQILKGTAPEDIDKNFIFHIFDLDSSQTLKSGIGNIKYTERRKNLSDLFDPREDYTFIKLGQMWEVDNMEEILAIYKKIVSEGGEGVICKNDHFYECKRSKNWVKLKEVNECDLIVTGWYEGEGKREGFIGGLVCTDLSKTLRVKIGAGFTDLDLVELSKDPDSLIGSIISVQYNVPITDKHNNRSLFLPRFVELRSDKKDPDDLSDLF